MKTTTGFNLRPVYLTVGLMLPVTVFAASSEGTRAEMGTQLTVRLEGPDSGALQRARDRFLEKISYLDRAFSVSNAESDIYRVNEAAGTRPVAVSSDTFALIEESLRYARLSHGAFDPTVGPLVRLWRQARKAGHWPSGAEVDNARREVDYRQVELNPGQNKIFLTRRGMALDLGGIAKGYALDAALREISDEESLDHVAANFGGQLLFWDKSGVFPSEAISIESPFEPGKTWTQVMISSNCSVSTAGNSEQVSGLRDDMGRLAPIGHLLDPRTGLPTVGGVQVTVVSSSATAAAAISTAIFVAGVPDGWALLSSHDGALVIDRDEKGKLRQSVRGLPLPKMNLNSTTGKRTAVHH